MNKEKMLIVDDSAFARLKLNKLFLNIFDIIMAENGEDALKIILELEDEISIVITDYNMPGMDGCTLIEEIKKYKQFENLPIILISDEKAVQLKALQMGAWDFVAKGTEDEIILARIKNVLERRHAYKYARNLHVTDKVLRSVVNNLNNAVFEYDVEQDHIFLFGNLLSKYTNCNNIYKFMEKIGQGKIVLPIEIIDSYNRLTLDNRFESLEIKLDTIIEGKSRWNKITCYAEFDYEGKLAYVSGLMSDINDIKEELIDTQYKAETDGLTGLLNRVTFESIVDNKLNLSDSNDAFISLDIDNFKFVNDNFGHDFGDLVLKKVADDITGTFRSLDSASRIGGDEFAIYVDNIHSVETLRRKLSILNKAINMPIYVNGDDFSVTVSIGAIFLNKDKKSDFETIYKEADNALYTSKHRGKNQITLREHKFY